MKFLRESNSQLLPSLSLVSLTQQQQHIFIACYALFFFMLLDRDLINISEWANSGKVQNLSHVKL